jgi:multicomponent K+:H+ antiporter subunit E
MPPTSGRGSPRPGPGCDRGGGGRGRSGAGAAAIAAPVARVERSGAGIVGLGAAFFVVAMMLAGLPPMAGFLGKFMLLSAALGGADATVAAAGPGAAAGGSPGAGAAWLVAAVLLNGLLAIVALARLGSRTFWKGAPRLRAPGRAALAPLAIPLALALALLVFAGPVSRHLDAAARGLYAPQPYVDAVLRKAPVPSRQARRRPPPPARPRPGRAGGRCGRHGGHGRGGRPMTRLLPMPLVSALVFALWLLLAGTVAPGQLLLAAALAIVLPLAIRPLWTDAPRIRRPGLVVALGLRVLGDIVKANLQVAAQVLGPQAALRPTFVWVPLDLREDHAIAALAGIITMTPGTLSADLSTDRRHLLVHALHAPDPEALVADIKARYEAPLKEIFA